MRFINNYNDLEDGMRILIQGYKDQNFTGNIYSINKFPGRNVTINIFSDDGDRLEIEYDSSYPSVPGNVKILVLREAPPKEVSFNGNNGDDDWGFC
jgi:hypothetical protein